MIVWIFVILTVLGILGAWIFYGYEKDILEFLSIVVAVISGAAIVISLYAIIESQIKADGERAKNEQRYQALVYKSQTESIRDDFGIVNKSYIDEVQAWNEELLEYQSYSHNFWIGIFYPKKNYEGFECIDLENIKMKGDDGKNGEAN